MPKRLIGKLTSKLKERVYKPICVAAICSYVVIGFSSKYTILPPVSDYPCIPGHVFLLDSSNLKINSGDLVTFKSHGASLFPDGTLFTKIAAGVAKEEVEVDRNLIINGDRIYQTDVSVTADHLNISLDSLSKKQSIKEGELFAIGTLPGSYDSRFWGVVDIQKQVLGKTYVIF